jgi:hypothetical protein
MKKTNKIKHTKHIQNLVTSSLSILDNYEELLASYKSLNKDNAFNILENDINEQKNFLINLLNKIN